MMCIIYDKLYIDICTVDKEYKWQWSTCKESPEKIPFSNLFLGLSLQLLIKVASQLRRSLSLVCNFLKKFLYDILQHSVLILRAPSPNSRGSNKCLILRICQVVHTALDHEESEVFAFFSSRALRIAPP